MTKLQYRADIDGLRAIAVISVLLFHFDINRFSGGFVGVDVFFVISGFLITRLIKHELETGNFSLINFYLRRARRLFPALFVTLLVCFVCAYQFFSALHFQRFGGALLYAIFSVSNIYFWNEQGYFDTEVDFKPLLHTWTLSVEEQFYLIWPALLLLLLTVRHKHFAVIAIGLLGLVSLYAAESYLAIDANAVFFLTPFRMFEFSIGAITVWLVQEHNKHTITEEIILLSGLAMIAYAVLSFDHYTRFPGYNALIPCLGTVMAIHAGRARFSGKLLANPITVNIGLMSYSIYLIHWPLYVFYQYPVPHSLENSEIAALFAITLLLATLMYHLVETPFRRLTLFGKNIPTKSFVAGCLLSAVITTILAAHVWNNNGWSWRQQHTQITINQSTFDVEVESKKRRIYINENPDCHDDISVICTSGTSADTIDGLVVGNSHGVDGYNALTIASKGKHKLSMLALGACDAVLDPEKQIPRRWPNRKECLDLHKLWFNPATYQDYDYLAISTLISGWFRAEQLKQYLQFIQSQTQIKRIIVFGNYIQLTQPLHSVINNGKSLQDNVLHFKESAFLDNDKIRKICQQMGCLFIDKKKLFCSNEDIRTCTLDVNGTPFIWDKHHLSLEFSTWMGQLAAGQIERYLNKPLE
jgi:peptidoglycan/LPS O-acetylase OafA/YrhL